MKVLIFLRLITNTTLDQKKNHIFGQNLASEPPVCSRCFFSAMYISFHEKLSVYSGIPIRYFLFVVFNICLFFLTISSMRGDAEFILLTSVLLVLGI